MEMTEDQIIQLYKETFISKGNDKEHTRTKHEKEIDDCWNTHLDAPEPSMFLLSVIPLTYFLAKRKKVTKLSK